MCLMVPGKIVKISKGKATVDYGTEKREAGIVEKGYKVGDYVIVQGKVVVSKVSEKEAIAALKNYSQQA